MLIQYRLAALAAAIAVGFFAVWKVTSNAYDAGMLKLERQHQEQIAAQVQRANDIAQKYEDARDNVKTVYRTIEKAVATIVNRPVYRDCVLDADGLRIWNEANEGSAAALANPAVPEAPRPR